MKFAYGSSKKGDVSEALKNITEPEALFFSVADESMLEQTANEIERRFPGVASIGGVGQAYSGIKIYYRACGPVFFCCEGGHA